jgi:hypothetical protein
VLGAMLYDLLMVFVLLSIFLFVLSLLADYRGLSKFSRMVVDRTYIAIMFF